MPKKPRRASARPKPPPGAKKLSQRFLTAAAISQLLAVGAVWATMLANKATGEAKKSEDPQMRKKNWQPKTSSGPRLDLDRELASTRRRLRLGTEQAPGPFAPPGGRSFAAENTFEARDSLFKALHDRPQLRTFLHIEEGYVRAVAFSPDGKTIAAGYSSPGGGGVVLWDVAAASAGRRAPPREGGRR